MAQIVQQGALNTTALVVPDLYVQIVPPQNLVLNGVPSNRIGVVGTAAWGPVNKPVIIGSFADYSRNFGTLVARKYDMGTIVATAVQQGAADFRCVRVTDGTDTSASTSFAVVGGSSAALTLVARYTGSAGNSLAATISVGPRASSYRVTIAAPGVVPEVFDVNAGATTTINWTNIATAINTGVGVLRGPSQYVVASLGSNTVAPVPINVTQGFNAGSDGAAAITVATLIGADLAMRAGMYALRGQGCTIMALADADDTTQWTTQVGFALSESLYAMLVGPNGDTIANAIATKQAAGVDSYAAKVLFGDWIYWNDPISKQLRLVSPQGFIAGRLANLSPEQSSLNKALYGIVSSQKAGTPGSGQFASYSVAELSALIQAGFDLIANPVPGGNYWGARAGHNSSTDPTVYGDNYTRMTNYIATTLAAGLGIYVGQPINVTTFRRVRGTQLAYLSNLLQQGLLGTVDGTLPYAVVCDVTNNPPDRVGLGYLQADVQVRYQAIAEKFIANIEGGQTVTINRQTLPSGQVGV